MSLCSLSSSSSPPQPAPTSRFAMSVSMIFVIFIIPSLVTIEAALGAELQREKIRKVTASSSSSSSSFSTTSSSSSSVPVKRGKRQARDVSQPPIPSGDQLGEIIDQMENSSGNENLLLYTPSTPSPEDINCHVELPVVHRIGGRCVNLGTFNGCQAGVHLVFDATCNERLGVPSQGDAGAPRQGDLRSLLHFQSLVRRRSNNNNNGSSRARP